MRSALPPSTHPWGATALLLLMLPANAAALILPPPNHVSRRALALPSGVQACAWPPLAGVTYLLVNSATGNTAQPMCVSANLSNLQQTSGAGTFSILEACSATDANHQISFTPTAGSSDYIINFAKKGTCLAQPNMYVGDGSPVEQDVACTKNTINAVWRVNTLADSNTLGQLISTTSQPAKCLGVGNVAARGEVSAAGDPLEFFTCGASATAAKEQFFALASADCGGGGGAGTAVPVPAPAPAASPKVVVVLPVVATTTTTSAKLPAAASPTVVRATSSSAGIRPPALTLINAPAPAAATPLPGSSDTSIITNPTTKPAAASPLMQSTLAPTAGGALLTMSSLALTLDPTALNGSQAMPLSDLGAVMFILAPIAVVGMTFAVVAGVRRLNNWRYLRFEK
ncbi:hypothetical protein HDU87_001741 [Geranomyces variabilis]|uniref:Ricin B lectin domain-containing protein n=1 Tax=Geranomyces variabilis TaxID=109894 RepID=A0AAD5XLQ3_9FUNG|nr:hypothetical protein HDU87_001741 [Geranomyces variabilis]